MNNFSTLTRLCNSVPCVLQPPRKLHWLVATLSGLPISTLTTSCSYRHYSGCSVEVERVSCEHCVQEHLCPCVLADFYVNLAQARGSERKKPR